MTIEFNDRTVDFNERYRVIDAEVMQRIEQRVIGSGYGANSYTTLAQADDLADYLGLAPDSLLLDIGSGAGWPAVYLARTSGCRVVLTDMTIEGLHVATGRMHREGVAGAGLAAGGGALPFRNERFDAATCSDVFCWLEDKLSVLRACNRVLKPGGRLAFLVIAAAPDLDEIERQRALEVGHVDAGPGYAALLDDAGFEAIDVQDVTTTYRETLASWYEAYEGETEALTDLIGAEDLADRQARRRRTLGTVDDGVVRRYRVTARRPDVG